MSTAKDRRHAIAFALTAVVLLGLFLLMLGGRRLAVDERTFFVVFRESVSGLEPSTEVEYNGVPVGTVRAIRLRRGRPGEVEVELGLDEELTVTEDMLARLEPQGITGLYQLELLGGTEGAKELPEGGTIAVQPSVRVSLESALRDLSEVIGLFREEGLADARDLVRSARDAARSLDATATGIGGDVHDGVDALRATASDVQTLLEEPAVRSLGADLAATLADVRRAVATIERAAEALARAGEDNRDDVRAIVQDLRRASADVRLLARRVRESPGSAFIEHPAVDKPFLDPVQEEAR